MFVQLMLLQMIQDLIMKLQNVYMKKQKVLFISINILIN